MATDGGMLAQLREQIHAEHDDTPPETRCRSRWVMSGDWLDDVRSLDYGDGLWWEPPGGPALLLGLPIEIREHGGAPHLELWPFDELIQFVITHYPEQVKRALVGPVRHTVPLG
jgi:hypothetical protein